jgi:hypothetical protein
VGTVVDVIEPGPSTTRVKTGELVLADAPITLDDWELHSPAPPIEPGPSTTNRSSLFFVELYLMKATIATVVTMMSAVNAMNFVVVFIDASLL